MSVEFRYTQAEMDNVISYTAKMAQEMICQIREDTVNEFLRELYPCKYKYNDDCFSCKGFKHCRVLYVEGIAKQLKEKKHGK